MFRKISLFSSMLLLSSGMLACNKVDLRALTQPRVIAEPVNVTLKADVIELKEGITILFKTGSDELLEESKPILNEVATVMDRNANLRIRVEGHTDADGSESSNLKLSEKRAKAVRDYLIAWGIASDRLDSVGCGETAPVADNETDEGKQKNRRVEFVILKDGVEPCKVYR